MILASDGKPVRPSAFCTPPWLRGEALRMLAARTRLGASVRHVVLTDDRGHVVEDVDRKATASDPVHVRLPARHARIPLDSADQSAQS